MSLEQSLLKKHMDMLRPSNSKSLSLTSVTTFRQTGMLLLGKRLLTTKLTQMEPPLVSATPTELSLMTWHFQLKDLSATSSSTEKTLRHSLTTSVMVLLNSRLKQEVTSRQRWTSKRVSFLLNSSHYRPSSTQATTTSTEALLKLESRSRNLNGSGKTPWMLPRRNSRECRPNPFQNSTILSTTQVMSTNKRFQLKSNLG